MMEISEEDFYIYEKQMRSASINVCNIKLMQELTGLSREQIVFIITHYPELSKKYEVIQNE